MATTKHFIIDTYLDPKYFNDYIAVIEKISKNNPNQKLKLKNYVRTTTSKGAPSLILDDYNFFQLLPPIYSEEKKNLKTRILSVDKPDKKREVVYITGPNGVGKTIFEDNYAILYKKIYPTRKIFFFSIPINLGYTKDCALTKSNEYEFVNVCDFVKLIEDNDIDDNKFKESLMIFDDLSLDAKGTKLIWDFINKITETYRKLNTSILVSAHLTTNYKLTRSIIGETDRYVFFPHSLAGRSNRLLKDYYKIPQKTIDKILKTTSTWVCVDAKKSIIIDEKQIYNI